MPTLLDYLGYNKEYVAFGKSLLSTPADSTFAVNYINDVYQYYKGDYMLQFDGQKSIALYNVRNDRLLTENLVGKVPQQQQMEREVKAIIQQYMTRMLNDRLVVETKE
jgi:hypothetical protein